LRFTIENKYTLCTYIFIISKNNNNKYSMERNNFEIPVLFIIFLFCWGIFMVSCFSKYIYGFLFFQGIFYDLSCIFQGVFCDFSTYQFLPQIKR
jgi:hypothetical protein